MPIETTRVYWKTAKLGERQPKLVVQKATEYMPYAVPGSIRIVTPDEHYPLFLSKEEISSLIVWLNRFVLEI